MPRARRSPVPPPSAWRNRIVGYGEEAPDQLLANPDNPRIHPGTQQDAISGILNEVGILQNIIVNKRTSEAWPDGERGVETLLDGHLRVKVALSEGQDRLPVTYVDLTPEEERLALAVFDPIAAMAANDPEILRGLLDRVSSGKQALQDLFAKLREATGAFAVNATGAPQLPSGDRAPFQQMTFTLHDSQVATVTAALERAMQIGCTSDINANSNGNALAFICAHFSEGD